MTRVQLTDEEWAFIGPYLPVGEFGPYPARLREQFAGVLWRFRTGGQWREMPAEFGAWSTVHNRFRQWRDAGVFAALLEGMIAEAGRRVWWTCRWSAWTRPRRAPITMRPGCI
jgi:transposase